MKLYIDTSAGDRITIGLSGDMITSPSVEEKSQRLLSLITEELKKRDKSLSDITEIEVNLGPGSFTGLRVGVSVANTLGWALGIPVNGKDVRKEGPVEPVYEKG